MNVPTKEENKLSEPYNFIDIDRIFSQKNPKLYEWLPKFVLNYLKKVIHQNEINTFQNSANHLRGIEYLNACLNFVGAKITYSGLEYLPSNGGVVLASNHPLGGLDGMALMQVVALVRTDIRFLVNDILTNLTNFEELFVPVNKIGVNTSDNLRRIDQVYQSQAAVLVFPAGLVSRRQNGVIADLPWSKSFISKAVQYNKPIIPIHINGRLSNFFYNLSVIRKLIGIKANIEMLYLADEMFKQRNKSIHITFGKPILREELGSPKGFKEKALLMQDFIYDLPKDNNISFTDWSNKREKTIS